MNNKVTIIGVGSVGATIAYTLVAGSSVSEIVLIDVNSEKAVSEALDIKQAMRAGCEPAEFIGAMGSQLVNVHICDWHENGALCLPCEGNFDFDAFMLALKREGYDGPIIVEPYLALIHSDEKLRQSLRKMEAAEQMADKILTARIDENAKAE